MLITLFVSLSNYHVNHGQEITGELPPETPLKPNEPLPIIRRRVRTEFTLSDKLLTEPKSQEEEELSKLELEFAIQSKIVAASVKLMNEVNIRKANRKQRKQNYEQAVSKLKMLEQKLIPIRKKLEDNRKVRSKKMKAKKQLIQELNNDGYPQQYPNGFMAQTLMIAPPSHLPIPPQFELPPPVPSSHVEKRSRRRQPIVMSVSSSVPSSPVLTREFRTEPVSPPDVTFVPISPAKRRLMKVQAQRPNSTLAVKCCVGDEPDFGLPPIKPSKVYHHVPSKSEPDTSSIHPNGTNHIKYSHAKNQNNQPETPPSILKNAKSTRSPPKKGVTIDERVIMNGSDEEEVKYRPFTPNLFTSSTEVPVEFQKPTSGRHRKYSADIHYDEKGRLANGSPVSDVFVTDADALLSRSNSLDITRRKSYVSAVNSPPSTPTLHHHQHYYNHHPSVSVVQKPLPRNPPPPVPESAGQRPLPLPPLPPVPLFDEKANVDFIQDGLDQISICSSSYGRETPRPVSIPLSPSVTGPSVEVVSVGQFTPGWEETKPFEMSDFYKYSTKHRNKQQQESSSGSANV